MAGTIFEHSGALRFDSYWYYAMYLMASTRCGISTEPIRKHETGVTWETSHGGAVPPDYVRCSAEPEMQLEGSAVEVDEMY